MKNPFMSAWLSAANKAVGPMRGALASAAKRQQNAMVKEATKAMGLGPAKKRTTPKRRPKA